MGLLLFRTVKQLTKPFACWGGHVLGEIQRKNCSAPEISRGRESLAIPTGMFIQVIRGTPWPMSLCR